VISLNGYWIKYLFKSITAVSCRLQFKNRKSGTADRPQKSHSRFMSAYSFINVVALHTTEVEKRAQFIEQMVNIFHSQCYPQRNRCHGQLLRFC